MDKNNNKERPEQAQTLFLLLPRMFSLQCSRFVTHTWAHVNTCCFYCSIYFNILLHSGQNKALPLSNVDHKSRSSPSHFGKGEEILLPSPLHTNLGRGKCHCLLLKEQWHSAIKDRLLLPNQVWTNFLVDFKSLLFPTVLVSPPSHRVPFRIQSLPLAPQTHNPPPSPSPPSGKTLALGLLSMQRWTLLTRTLALPFPSNICNKQASRCSFSLEENLNSVVSGKSWVREE